MAIRENYVFTSESVSEGHPDKVCDQVSDSVLDLFLGGDENSRVAAESLVTTNHLTVAGEISSLHQVDKKEIEKRVREVIYNIGYDSDEKGFDANKAEVNILLHTQSPDIAQGVDGSGLFKEEGAGDQGMMFGFAINETEGLMPAPIYYSHLILEELSRVRKNNTLKFLRPDAKSQVTVRYAGGKIHSIDTVVVSTQHSEDVTHEQITEAVIETVIKKIIPANLLQNTKYYVNPTGRFVVGGPHGDAGLTGRKIIVDTYGGFARHGGGAFSGKDPSKVDRSAAYMARYVAKNIVASGIAQKAEIQLAYAIGVAHPLSVFVDTFGTGKISDDKIEKLVVDNFDLTPRGIRETLNLRKIQYLPSASYGHFGRDIFPWEKTNKTGVFI